MCRKCNLDDGVRGSKIYIYGVYVCVFNLSAHMHQFQASLAKFSVNTIPFMWPESPNPNGMHYLDTSQ